MERSSTADVGPNGFREHLLVLSAYALLTALLTYPVVCRFSTHLIGDGTDTNLFVWSLWWFKKALVDLRTSPFWTDYIFYPEGTSLVLVSLVPLSGLVGIPLQRILGLVPTLNLLGLMAFVLSGYGAYLLIRYLIADRLSAFIGGMVFAFCPYTFAHLLGHFDLISTEWLPFYVLALLRLFERGQRGVRPPLLCALFLLLIALCSYYYLFYAFIFTALYTAHRIRAHGFQAFREKDSGKLASALGIFMIGFAPILVLAGIDVLREGGEMVTGGRGAAGFQADLLSFLTPSPLHPVFGPLAKPLADRFKGGVAEATVFAGYVPAALGIFAIRKLRPAEARVRFWSFALLVFFILSLGPFPRVLGHGIKPIPLPYQLIMRAPFLNNFRVPSRFDIMVMFCLAVLVAYSCRNLLTRCPRRAGRAFLFCGLSLVIIVEYLAVPFPTFAALVPGIYDRIGREPGAFAVLEIPLGRMSGASPGIGRVPPSFSFYQTVHGQKVFGGNISRASESRMRALETHPVLRQILALQKGEAVGGPRGAGDLRRIEEELKALRVRYVIIHPPFHRTSVLDYVETAFPVEKVFEEDGILAFQIGRRAPDNPR